MKWFHRFRFPISLEASWQFVSTVAIVAVALALLLFGRLDGMLPGYSQTEVETARASESIGAIVENPINAPFKLVVYAVGQLTDPLLATRIAAAVFGTLAILLFYFGVRNWHSPRVSFLATVLFATSAWFLHAARFGSTDIMLPLSVLLFATAGFWVASRQYSSLSYAVAMIALTISLFVPGMIWFVLAAILIRRGKDFRAIRRHFSGPQIAGLAGFFLVGVVAPLGFAFVNHPEVAVRLFGLPTSWPAPIEIAENLALVPVSLFFANSVNPELWLGHLPYLSIFSSVMFVLGLYYYFKFRSLDRAKLLAIFLSFGAVLVALGGVSDTMLLPGVYIAIAGGIALLLTQWLTVFPRNPLAQSVGIFLVTIAVALSTFYSLRAYFVAWPNNQETKDAYTLTQEDI